MAARLLGVTETEEQKQEAQALRVLCDWRASEAAAATEAALIFVWWGECPGHGDSKTSSGF